LSVKHVHQINGGKLKFFFKLGEKYKYSFTLVKFRLSILIGVGFRNGSGLKIRVNATNGLVLAVGFPILQVQNRDYDNHYNVLIHAEKLVNSVSEMGKYTMKAKAIIM